MRNLDPFRPGFEADVAEFMHQHFYRPVGDLVFGKLVQHLFHLTSKHGLTLPADLSTVLKALSLMENLVCQLDPGHDIIGQARPFMKQVRLTQLGPRRLLRDWQEFGSEAATFVREMPLGNPPDHGAGSRKAGPCCGCITTAWSRS